MEAKDGQKELDGLSRLVAEKSLKVLHKDVDSSVEEFKNGPVRFVQQLTLPKQSFEREDDGGVTIYVHTLLGYLADAMLEKGTKPYRTTAFREFMDKFHEMEESIKDLQEEV